MSKVIDTIKPTVEEQIAYIRKYRKDLERSVIIIEDPKHVKEYEHEIGMLRAIEENLIVIKVQMENKTDEEKKHCTKCQALESFAGEHHKGLCPKCAIAVAVITSDDEFAEPCMEQVNPHFEWPKVGESVIVLEGELNHGDWVNAYVTRVLPRGVIVKTFYNRTITVNDSLKIKKGSTKAGSKEVSRG